MTMTLDNLVLAIALMRGGTFGQTALLSAQTHGAAQIGILATLFQRTTGVLPLGDQTYHRKFAILLELGAVGIGHARNVARIFDDGDLHAEADAEIGNLVLTRIL